MPIAGRRSRRNSLGDEIENPGAEQPGQASSLESDESDDDGGIFDRLITNQYRAALRLDRAARLLAAIAWLVFFFGLAVGVIAAGVQVSLSGNAAFLLLAPGCWVVTLVIFLPLYFTPTWARAYAASQVVDAEQRWVSI
jgi:hypothetical protein